MRAACGRETDVGAPLEAVGGVGREAERLGRLADPDGVEMGALDEDVAGRFRDARGLAADDAGQGHRPRLVGDDEHVGREREGPAVEVDEGLAALGLADDDAAAADPAEIEGVDGLGRGEEDVVRDVDDVVDGPQAHGLDPAREPVGRRPDRDVPDDDAAVPGAEGLGDDLDVGDVRRGLGELGEGPILLDERKAQERRHLAGDAEVAERVGPVGVGLEVQDEVAVPLLGRVGDEADHRQLVEDLLPGEVDGDVFAEPVQADLHFVPNCLRNLRSFS